MQLLKQQELIKVDLNENNEPIVSGHTLHEVLEVKTRYDKWFARMCEYGFIENIDYIAIAQKRPTAQGNYTTYVDHILKLDMAKEIAMLQRTEKGKQIRQYFIQVEKEYNSPEKIMARALLMADKKIHTLELTLQEQRPKVIFADAVSVSKNSVLVAELAKMIKQNGVDIGQRRLFEWLRQNGYLIKRKGSEYNMPTQKSMNLGLLVIKEGTRIHSDGHTSLTKTPKVTGKGQQYFINKFLGGYHGRNNASDY